MRKVHLHGALGEQFGETFTLDIQTAGEAVRALAANFPDFLPAIREGSYHVVRGDTVDDGFDLDEEMIAEFNLGRGDLHIVPVIAGSKRGGLLKVILGVALIGASFFMGGFGAPLVLGGLKTGLTWGNIAMMGGALALAGASQLLAPEQESEDDKKQSFLFQGPGNAYEQGLPVPLVYGEVITGSLLISGGIDVEDMLAVPPATNPATGPSNGTGGSAPDRYQSGR